MRGSGDNVVWLTDIAKSIDLVESYTSNITEDDFFESEHWQDAVVRRLEVIGEAVKNLPESFRAKHPNVAWSKASGMRNILTHEYFNVDVGIVWQALKEDLPLLKSQVLELIEKEKEQN